MITLENHLLHGVPHQMIMNKQARSTDSGKMVYGNFIQVAKNLLKLLLY
jgi:hypothetical protein